MTERITRGVMSLIGLSFLAVTGCNTGGASYVGYYHGYYGPGPWWGYHDTYVIDRPVYVGVPDYDIEPDYGAPDIPDIPDIPADVSY